MSVNEKMTAIADNIRSKTGGTESLTLDQMASGVNEVYEAGCTNLIKALTNNQQRTNFTRFFNNSDCTGLTFNSSYFENAVETSYFFYGYKGTELPKGIILPKATSIGINGFGASSEITEIPDMQIPLQSTYLNCFNSCEKLVTIGFPIKCDENTIFTNIVTKCYKLVNITFDGVIGQNISFSYSPLSGISMKSVITHLKDYSADTANHYKYTVAFKTSAFEALEAEGNTSPNGNTWAEYIDDLKWNLTLA